MSRALTRLIVCCVLLRALIPAGFMPVPAVAQDGIFSIVICTADGFSTITVDGNGDPVDPDHGGDAPAKDHCPFAPVGWVIPTVIPADPQPRTFSAAVARWSPIEAAGHAHYRPTSLNPRAPPA